MKLLNLALRGIRFHWRAYGGVLLGSAIAASILVGALAVGDSVRYTLRRIALSRLGDVQLALVGESRFFRTQLADEFQRSFPGPAAPIIMIRGIASVDDVRVNKVQVLGVDDRFWSLAPSNEVAANKEGLVINQRLAALLNARPGSEVLLRVDKPSLLSRDAPLSTVEDSTVAFRLQVTEIVDDSSFGRFSLEANQTPPLNAFVPIRLLGDRIGMRGRANTLLVGGSNGDEPAAARAAEILWRVWRPEDAGLTLREIPGQNEVELRTDRVFLDPPVGDAALRAYPGARGALTYFVNELKVGERSTPYSTVSALQNPLIPPGMKSDEALINGWLANDLKAKVGDTLALRYWVVGPMRKLTEQTSQFRIRGVLPMQGAAVDPALMPDIPGLSDKKNCRDWEPGVPVDLDRIRDKDQAYWDVYRGSPKAFITLAAGQRIWENRFGSITSVRYPAEGASRVNVESCIKQALTPAALGLFFSPLRERALAATSPTLDFGQLFLGFSFFLILAALILTALLFGFAVEQRAAESGMLLAVGFRSHVVRRLFLLEAAGIAILGSLLGSFAALLYTRAVVEALSGVWSSAVAGSVLEFHADSGTLIAGGAASFIIAMLSVWFVSRSLARRSARELLSESAADGNESASSNRVPGTLALVAGIGGVAMAVFGLSSGSEAATGMFFGAGFFLLISGTAATWVALKRLRRSGECERLSLTNLGTRNVARRGGRTLAAIVLLASGTFLVIAVGANRHDPRAEAHQRSSGTGGFALYAESATPIFQDLNSTEGLQIFGLDASDLRGARVVSFRVREGDDASCLNLNRAITPRIMGVNPQLLSDRFQFAKAEGEPDWVSLEQSLPGGEVPAIGDVNTVTWSLGKGLGQTLDYQDERGRKRKLRIVGVLADSILQGSLMVSEDRFIEMFPSESGYRTLLIDAPASSLSEVAGVLTRATEDIGLSVTPAAERLAAFSAVENTYLSIFAVLGALGLVLGSAGLGVIVLRNVLDRRSELAVLGAIGFRRRLLHRLIFTEHAIILFLGLIVGIVSALIAVLPSISNVGQGSPLVSILVSLGAVLVNGLVWTWLATLAALRGRLVSALRSE